MKAVYTINDKPYRLCDCDPMSEVCYQGRKRPLQTCGFANCLVPAPEAMVVTHSESAPNRSDATTAPTEANGNHAAESSGLTGDGVSPGGAGTATPRQLSDLERLIESGRQYRLRCAKSPDEAVNIALSANDLALIGFALRLMMRSDFHCGDSVASSRSTKEAS